MSVVREKMHDYVRCQYFPCAKNVHRFIHHCLISEGFKKISTVLFLWFSLGPSSNTCLKYEKARPHPPPKKTKNPKLQCISSKSALNDSYTLREHETLALFWSLSFCTCSTMVHRDLVGLSSLIFLLGFLFFCIYFHSHFPSLLVIFLIMWRPRSWLIEI